MNFEECLLQDVAAKVPNAIVGGPFGSNLVSADYTERGVPVIRGQNMGMGRWVNGDFVFVSEEKAKRLSQNIARPGDLIFTQRGTLGQVAIVPDSGYERYVISQSQMKITVDPSKADVRFLLYLFSTPHQRRYIYDNSIQTGVPHTNLSILKKTPIILPPLAMQIEIAEILSSLDDKIELNRRMNATLEAMAQALFKSWFVDFEPVKAKAAGRAPEGMDADTAALFPSEFQDSELGLIPKGWKCLPLNEAFEINPTRKLAKATEASYLDMANVPTQGHRPMGWINRAFSSGTKFINGDTLLARITPCLENGKTAFVDFLPEGETGWGSTEFIVIRPKPPLPAYFAYLLCREPDFRSFAIQSMTGTSGRQRVQIDSLGKYLLAIPPNKAAERFGEIIRPLIERISCNSEESSSLTGIRDALLPKLISGQLRVPAE